MNTNEMNPVLQEGYDAAHSSYTDPFGAKFDSFDAANIVTGNNTLKQGINDMDIEDSSIALGYKNTPPATTPKPGKFFD
jgi:hypothetical protein